MMDQLINFVVWVLGPLVALAVLVVLSFLIKRATREYLENKYAGGAGPVWFLSATLLSTLCLIVAIRALWTPSRWVDPAVWTWLTRIVFEDADAAGPFSFPESAYWIAGAILIVTAVYSLVTLVLAWLLGPPRAASRKAESQSEARRGLPPPSSAASSREPRMGLLMALDTAASSGVIQWLYTHLGYWNDPRPGAEPRYRGWVEPLHNILAWIKWPSLFIAAFGVTSALVWVTAALLHDALKQLLALPKVPPQSEEEEEEEEEEVEPEKHRATEQELISSLAHELVDRGFSIRSVGTSKGRPAVRSDERWPSGGAGPLWTSVLDQWRGSPLQLTETSPEGFWPYPSQLEVAQLVIGGEDTLLSSPRGSGKATIADLLSAYTTLCQASSVLIIVPTPEDSKERVGDLRKLGMSGRWHWVVNVHDLATDGIGGLDPLVEQPEIVVGTVDALEKHFMAVSSHWDIFLATLSLVVVCDVDAHSGPRATSLGSLCRRVKHLADDLGADLTFFATSRGLWKETTSLAEEVTGRSLEIVDNTSAGGAPRPEQAISVISCDEEMIEQLREHILSMGWDLMILDDRHRGHRLYRAEDPADHAQEVPKSRHRLAVLAPVSTSHLPVMLDELVHLPSGSAPQERVLLLRTHLPCHSLSTTVLHPTLTETPLPRWLIGQTPTLANGWGNPAAAARSLQRALTERDSSRVELEEDHGKEATRHELEVLEERGLLGSRPTARPDEATGLPTPLMLFRLSDPLKVRVDAEAEVVTNDPLIIREASSLERLIAVDGVRAQGAFYPGCVFHVDGRRFRIREDSDELVAEPEPEEVFTAPIRRLEIELEGWTPQTARFGGTESIEYGRGAVTVCSTVYGVRRFDWKGQLLDERVNETPLTSTYPSRAALLRFHAPTSGETFTEAAVHGVVHSLRAVLPIVIRSSWHDLDVAQLPVDDSGWYGVVLVDLHPFGSGFADVFRPGRLKLLLRRARSMASEYPTAAAPGLCLSPSDQWQAPLAEAAVESLDLVLGPHHRERSSEH